MAGDEVQCVQVSSHLTYIKSPSGFILPSMVMLINDCPVPVSYHMQNAHGVSPSSALPFSPPLSFRLAKRKQNHKNEKAEILEGLCHKCNEWAPMEGVKCVPAKVSLLLAISCSPFLMMPTVERNLLVEACWPVP